MTHIVLDQFTGPFSLLLSLIDDEKLSISDLSLSKVTEQYLCYLETLEEKKADELSDFLLVASRLLLLKARMLLPQLQVEEDEGPGLEEQLRLYKMFLKASHHVEKQWLLGNLSYGRVEALQRTNGFVVPENVSDKTLLDSMHRLLRRIKPPKALAEIHVDRAVSMRETIDRIKHLFKKLESSTFDDMLQEKENTTERVVSFLAILELVKQKIVSLQQQDNFGTIHIYKT
jgi:segregation and condensation protein A